MRILGAILAGGRSTRFGSDKAHALVGGVRLIDLVADALTRQCDAVVICGRDEPGFDCIPDRPTTGLGPLGGLNAALRYAQENGYDCALVSPCDVPNLPPDLTHSLASDGAAIVVGQPVVGLWPCALADELDRFILGERFAVMAFAEKIGARRVMIDPPLANVNKPGDL